jgi:TetR/AcrR family transcriptional regulator
MASKPGERKQQTLQALADMLEQPHAARITTAALATRLQISEAALYRHFASKAQIFEGLIDFTEQSIFTLIDQIAERNKGITCVLTGDALVTEDNRLQERVNHLNDRIEASFRQSLQIAVNEGGLLPTTNVDAYATVLTHFVMGQWLRYAQIGWQMTPTLHVEAQLAVVL